MLVIAAVLLPAGIAEAPEGDYVPVVELSHDADLLAKGFDLGRCKRHAKLLDGHLGPAEPGPSPDKRGSALSERDLGLTDELGRRHLERQRHPHFLLQEANVVLEDREDMRLDVGVPADLKGNARCLSGLRSVALCRQGSENAQAASAGRTCGARPGRAGGRPPCLPCLQTHR